MTRTWKEIPSLRQSTQKWISAILLFSSNFIHLPTAQQCNHNVWYIIIIRSSIFSCFFNMTVICYSVDNLLYYLIYNLIWSGCSAVAKSLRFHIRMQVSIQQTLFGSQETTSEILIRSSKRKSFFCRKFFVELLDFSSNYTDKMDWPWHNFPLCYWSHFEWNQFARYPCVRVH